jgi:hypothetical protein
LTFFKHEGVHDPDRRSSRIDLEQLSERLKAEAQLKETARNRLRLMTQSLLLQKKYPLSVNQRPCRGMPGAFDLVLGVYGEHAEP